MGNELAGVVKYLGNEGKVGHGAYSHPFFIREFIMVNHDHDIADHLANVWPIILADIFRPNHALPNHGL